MQNDLKRRDFLKMSIGGLGVGLIANKAAAAAPMCLQTAPQTEGPFYPGEEKFLAVNDLTRVEGAKRSAEGQVIYLNGVVQDLNCLPIAGVNVEIWQACASGRYNNPNDPNQAPLDPNFRYWGETYTDEQGNYDFKTILPGAYPADTDWDRPPHIHFRLSKRGYHELITQMYFKGHPLNDADKILQHVPERLRDAVIVDFKVNPAEPSSLVGRFNISIEKV